jgi:hypothetical protein
MLLLPAANHHHTAHAGYVTPYQVRNQCHNEHVISQVSRLKRLAMQINPTTATGLIEQAGLDEVSPSSPDL